MSQSRADRKKAKANGQKLKPKNTKELKPDNIKKTQHEPAEIHANVEKRRFLSTN